jgi:radical SAM superfamily enzyme YgiQ (UPF0313 family)
VSLAQIGIRRAARPQRATLVKSAMQVARGNHMTFACPPLGVAYLASSLRANGVPVTIVDAVGEAPDEVRAIEHEPGQPALLRYGLADDAIVRRIPADTTIIGVSAMFSEEWPITRASIHAMRTAFPSAVIFVGGEHASAAPELVLRECPSVAACVIGEGEETLVDLVDAVASGRSFDGVAGIVWRDGAAIRTNARRARIRAVDAIPEPAWDLVPMEKYLSRGLGYGVDRGRSVPIIATRGCPFQCTFCSSPAMWTTRWSARDPDAVLAEMERAITTYRAQNFDFYDLTAIVKRDWILEFSRRLTEKRWGVTWQLPAGTRSEAIDAEVAKCLYASGCRNIAYAPESGSPTLLARVKKKVNLDRMKASMRDAIAAGLKVKCNMIMGFPDETRAEMDETLRFCRDLARIGVHDINVTPFCPYPGSALFDALLRSGTIDEVDDAYFRMLASYSDLANTISFCASTSSGALSVLRWSAMAQFYGLSFAHRPARILSLAKNLATGKQTTRLERALSDIAKRQEQAAIARL